jgi:hypothetical protein
MIVGATLPSARVGEGLETTRLRRLGRGRTMAGKGHGPALLSTEANGGCGGREASFDPGTKRMLCTLRFRPFPGLTFPSAPPLVGSLSGRLHSRLRRDSLQNIIPFIIASSGGLCGREKPFPALCPDFFQLIHAVAVHLAVACSFLQSLAKQTRRDYLKGAADNRLLREVGVAAGWISPAGPRRHGGCATVEGKT